MITRCIDSFDKGRASKADNDTRHIYACEFRLAGGDFYQRLKGRLLCGHAAGADGIEPAGNFEGVEPILIRKPCVYELFDILSGHCFGDRNGGVGCESADNGKRGGCVRVGRIYFAVCFDLVHPPIHKYHFTVQSVEGADSKIAILQQLVAGCNAGIGARQEGINRGYLGYGVAGR